MLPLYFSVDVMMERVPLVNRWVSEQWRPAAIVPVGMLDAGARPAKIGKAQCVRNDAAGTLWRFPDWAIELHPSEAEGYFLNIGSETPLVFVMWRAAESGTEDLIDHNTEPAARPEMVTVSYNQAGRIMDGGEKVDPVPMPEAILEWIRPFVAEHYKPEPKRKMKRNDPFKDDATQRDRPPRA